MKSQQQSSNILTRKWRQFWCLHHWRKDLPVDLQYGKGYLYRFDCTICEKTVYRFTGREPISGMVANQPMRQDPLYTMSPIRRTDDAL